MAVRTTKVDVLALVRSSPGNPFALKRPGGGGAGLEVATPPQITNFEFEVEPGLEGDVGSGTLVALISAQPETAVFTLVDDAGGLLELDGVDGNDKTRLVVDGESVLPPGDYDVTIRATVGVVSADFTRTVTVSVLAFNYDVDRSASSVDAGIPQGEELVTFDPVDERLTITAVTILADAADLFDVDGVTLVRGAGAVVDGPYDVTLQYTWDGDGAQTPTTTQETYQFDVFSLG